MDRPDLLQLLYPRVFALDNVLLERCDRMCRVYL